MLLAANGAAFVLLRTLPASGNTPVAAAAVAAAAVAAAARTLHK